MPTPMSSKRAQDLADLCIDLVRKGNDFSTVWTTLLENHPLVNGIPDSKLAEKRGMLEIRLITGERLVYDGDGKKFSVKPSKREGLCGVTHAGPRLIFVRTAKHLPESRLRFPKPYTPRRLLAKIREHLA